MSNPFLAEEIPSCGQEDLVIVSLPPEEFDRLVPVCNQEMVVCTTEFVDRFKSLFGLTFFTRKDQ